MSYLKNLAEIFAHEVGDQLHEYVFVFPNQRAGLFFRRDLGLALGRPALSPKIITINDCFYDLAESQLADQIDLLLRVVRIHNEIRAEQHREPEPLDQFLFWAKMILSDFNEVDNHLVPDVQQFFDNIRDLHSIDSHFHLSSTIHHPQSTNWEAPLPLYDIYSRLQAELRAEGLAYDGMLHREVIDSLTANVESGLSAQRSFSPKDGLSAEGGPTSKTYVFIGFNALTASEEQLMLYFKEQGQADFYFDYSDPLVTRKDNRASLFMERNRHLFPSKYQTPSTIALRAHHPQSTKYHYIEVSSTVAEAQEVHRILENLSDAANLTRTAVVLPDEHLLIPLLHTLPESIDKVNITMGYPLSATPTYALISLITSLQQRQTEHGFYHKDVTAILSHPYIHSLSSEACDAIKHDIVKRNRIYIDAATFANDELLGMVFSTEPDAWREILNHFPEEASEAVYRVQTVLNRIDKYLGPSVPQGRSFSTAVSLLLSSESIPYTGEPLEGLQIMGILETRALDFDNIILTGFNDDLYPGNSIANSFIPYPMRCRYDLPTAQRKDAIFAYNFYRMIGYAKQVWFIANRRADDQHSGEPSRYLYQLQYQFEQPIKHIVVQDSLSVTLHDLPIAPLGAENSQLSTFNSFTPSGLNTYLRCPRLYYWQYVQGLKESEEVHEDLDPRELGTQLHLFLQNCYEPFCGKTVTKEDIKQMLKSLSANAESSLSAEGGPLAKRSYSEAILSEYAGLILERDLALAPFTYIATEQPRTLDLTLEDGTVVTLKGTIDRIDTSFHPQSTIHNPHYRIVDYKTGGADLEFASVASLFDPTDSKRNGYALQTILYSVLYGGGEPHIYSVRLLATGSETAVHQKGHETVDVAAIQEEFMGYVSRLISEIRHPDNTFPCTEDTFNKCSKCPFAKLCER